MQEYETKEREKVLKRLSGKIENRKKIEKVMCVQRYTEHMIFLFAYRKKVYYFMKMHI